MKTTLNKSKRNKKGRKLGLKRIVRIFANIRISLNRTNIFRGSNSRQQRSFHFQWFVQKLCTVALCPAPVGHPIAIDEMTRIDQHNLAARIACLSFWKQRCFYLFDRSKIRSEADGPSRSMAFRWRRSLELFSRTPLHRLVSVANSDCKLWYRLKLNFPFILLFLFFFFVTIQAWCFQG